MQNWQIRIFKRIPSSIVLILIVSVLIFYLANASGSPVSLMIEDNPGITAQDVQQLNQYFHLNQPIYLRYLYWLWDALHLNFGYSYLRGASVVSIVVPYLLGDDEDYKPFP